MNSIADLFKFAIGYSVIGCALALTIVFVQIIVDAIRVYPKIRAEIAAKEAARKA